MDHDAQQREILTLDNSQRFHLPLMNPIPPAPTPAPKRITPTEQPVFPCWLYGSGTMSWLHFSNRDGFGPLSATMYTHWLPDQPTAPTCVPTEGENLKAPVVGLTDGENLDLAGISVYGKPTHSAQEAARKAADEILLYMGCSPRDQLAISAIILRHFQAVPAQSPGSGEALRAVLEKVASGSQLRLDFPRYRLPESLCDEIRKALAQPATPPLTSGERDYLAEIATLAETTLKHLEPSCSAAVEIRNALSRLELMRSAHPPSVKIGDGTDSQRLDWLEAHGHGVMSGRNSSDNRWQVSENNGKGGSLIGGHNGDRGTIRAAIDAAMQADAGREEK